MFDVIGWMIKQQQHQQRVISYKAVRIHPVGPSLNKEKSVDKKNCRLLSRSDITSGCNMKLTELGGRGYSINEK